MKKLKFKLYTRIMLWKIRKTREYLSTIPFIHCGGCGIAAYVLFKILERKGYKPNVITYYSKGDSNIDKNLQFLIGKHCNGESASHVAIFCNNIAFDCKEYDTISWCQNKLELIIPYEKSENYLLSAIKYSSWNPEFSRETYLPQIEKFFNLKII